VTSLKRVPRSHSVRIVQTLGNVLKIDSIQI